MLAPDDLFDLSDGKHHELFDGCEFVWDALKRIDAYIRDAIVPNISGIQGTYGVLDKTCVLYDGEVLDSGFELSPGDVTKGKFRVFKDGQELVGATVLFAGACLFDEKISIGQGTVVEPGALIKGPTIIGKNTDIRQGAYIRGACLVGDRCVVGHTTEMKTSVMLNDAKAGHFAYIGDSIMGNNVNLGAGTKLANLKLIDSNVTIKINDISYNTGIRKFGAIMGDGVETGCNSVTNPGTIIGKASMVYPCVSVKGGYYLAGSRIQQRN
ncbi:MAG: glucose-1-phosphate thymidylyltransferase [Candidatus Desantisbacteria bacterium]